MNIDEVKELREDVEQTIAELLGNFEAKTKTHIEHIEIERINREGVRYGSILNVQIIVKL